MDYLPPLLSPCSHKPAFLEKARSSEASGGGDNGSLGREYEEDMSSSSVLEHGGCSPYEDGGSPPDAPWPSVYASTMDADSGKELKSLQKREKGLSRRTRRVPKVASFVSSSQQRGVTLGIRRRTRRTENGANLEGLGLSLGMSIAAVMAQVVDKQERTGEKIPAVHLSMICMSAVKESVSNVFGDKLDPFVQNFEKSFDSTLKTLWSINEASNYDRTCDIKGCSSEKPPSLCAARAGSQSANLCCCTGESQEAVKSDSVLHQLIPYMETSRQSTQITRGSGHSNSILSTWEKSVTEQTRSNDLKSIEMDLKTLEIALKMKRLSLEESQLNLSSDANSLERFKIAMGISKAAFKEEKFKTQVREARYAELVKSCIDCLVAGLLIMSTCLVYGACIYSYDLLKEVTTSCSYSAKESNSWWVPNPMASITAGFQSLRCHVIVLSRLLFGLLIILALSYAILQRSTTSGQTMPITFILLLLGVVCGFAGKVCVDTLGGSGVCWLLYWEVLCSLHFFANVFTPLLFRLLVGTVSVCPQNSDHRVWVPYQIRRVLFYSVLFLVPVLCGLLPFASLLEWKDHFISVIGDRLLGS